MDVRQAIDQGRMSGLQLGAVTLCFVLNMLDGVDLLSLSFSAPLLSREWGIEPATLGVVFSAALAGMMAGSMLLAPVGDVLGRRKLLMFSLLLIATGMLGVVAARSLGELVVLRFITGLGLGGVVPTTTALAAEFSPERHRSFAVTLVSAGYPLGATLTGLVAPSILPPFGWHALFVLGGVLTIVSLPCVYFLLPESTEFLLAKQPRGALAQVNRMLRALSVPEVDTLPPPPAARSRSPGAFAALADLFSAPHLPATLLLWVAVFMALAGNYFLQNWVPQLIANAGRPDAQSFLAGTLLNLGLFTGEVSVGWFGDRFGLRRATGSYLAGGALLLLLFSYLTTTPAILGGLAVMGFLQGGFIGLYAVGARIYPVSVRITGIGWAIGVGRVGAILGPVIAGLLVARGFDLAASFAVFAVPLALAAIAVASMRAPALDPPAARRALRDASTEA